MSSILPTRYTMSAWQGADFRKSLVILTGAAGSSPRDLTNFTGVLNLRSAPHTTPIYSASSSNGGVVLGGVTGAVILFIPATATSTLSSCVYDLSFTNTSTGAVDSVLWGPFRITGVA